MGKLRPSILTGMFSHLSMNNKKKDKSEYEDLRQISPKSKVKQKSKGKKILSSASSLIAKIKPTNQNEVLLTPTKLTPDKFKKSKKSKVKLGVQQILDQAKKPFSKSAKYDEILESPATSSSNPSVKREKFKNSKASSLRERMLKRLKAARFR